MADNDMVGYVANYPIFGTIASINAFALGVRLTNPRARVQLRWSCVPGEPVRELTESGVKVISNRDAVDPRHGSRGIELGTYVLGDGGELTPLAIPCWNWGPMYEKIVRSVFSGAWSELSASMSVNYWWGMDSGVIDVELSSALPDGVCSLGWMLKEGITAGRISPFRTRILDQSGTLRNDGLQDLSPEEIMTMKWLCDTVDGDIPGFDELLPMSREMVRLLGVYRRKIPPEVEGEKQL
jgi:basic membrane lipoprotein Med (substrate-binding protein (PBP1-ABC) superfamily)